MFHGPGLQALGSPWGIRGDVNAGRPYHLTIVILQGNVTLAGRVFGVTGDGRLLHRHVTVNGSAQIRVATGEVAGPNGKFVFANRGPQRVAHRVRNVATEAVSTQGLQVGTIGHLTRLSYGKRHALLTRLKRRDHSQVIKHANNSGLNGFLTAMINANGPVVLHGVWQAGALASAHARVIVGRRGLGAHLYDDCWNVTGVFARDAIYRARALNENSVDRCGALG